MNRAFPDDPDRTHASPDGSGSGEATLPAGVRICPDCGTRLSPAPGTGASSGACPACAHGAPGGTPPALQRSEGGDATLLAPSRRPGQGCTDAAPAPSSRGDDRTIQRPSAGPGAAHGPRAEDPRAGEGTPFGRYRLLSKLGSGGMGVVWKAYDPAFRRVVALKQIRHDADNSESADRFMREARLAGALRHPHIVTTYDVGSVGDRHFLTMEMVEGQTLAAWLDETRDAKRDGTAEGMRRLREEVAVLASVSEAVAYAHSQGIIHRDLKPGNVLLDHQGKPFVMDFGLAREVEPEGEGSEAERRARTQLTHTGQLLGTPSYMSPEQANGDLTAIGPASDVWSLGVMLYETLTGTLPLEGRSTLQLIAAVLQDEPRPRPRERNRLVPPELEAVCLKAIERDREIRYRSATEFAAELRRWLQGDPVLAKPPTRWHLARRWVRRHRARIVPIAAVLLVLLIAASWVTVERTRRRARGREILAKVAGQVRDFVDTVMSTEMTPEAIAALTRQPLIVLDDLVAEDPEYGPARSWRGLVYQYLDRREEAAAEFDAAWRLSPNYSVVCYLRALSRLDRYLRERPFPSPGFLGGAVRAVDAAPETPAQTALREGALRDLERVDSAEMRGDALDESERLHAHALAALMRGGPEGAEKALRALDGAQGPLVEEARGRALHLLGRWQEAEEAYDRLLARWPRYAAGFRYRADSRLFRAMAERASGQDARPTLRAALADLDAALERAPGDLVAYGDRGHVYRTLGEALASVAESPDESLAAAAADLTRVLANRPNDLRARVDRGGVHVVLAQFAIRRGREFEAHLHAADDDLDKAVEAAPGHAVARLYRASAAILHAERAAAFGGDPISSLERAFADLDTVLRDRPDESDALQVRAAAGVLLGLAQKGEESRRTLERVVTDAGEAAKLAPGNPEPLHPRAQALHALGCLDARAGRDPFAAFAQARKDADALAIVRPGDPSIRHLRAQIAQSTARAQADRGQDPRESLHHALADLDAVLAGNPHMMASLEVRALVLLDLGEAERKLGSDPGPRIDAAIADLDRVIAVDPRPASPYGARGWARFLRAREIAAAGRDPSEEESRAAADFEEALARDPGSAAHRGRRGMLHLERSQRTTAHGTDARPILLQALADLSAASELEPANVHRRSTLASARVLLAQLQAAAGEDAVATCREVIAELDAILAILPADGKALLNRGTAHMLRGQLAPAEARADFDAAERDYRAATAAGEPLAWMNLGILHRLQARPEDAVRAFETAGRALPALAERARREIAEVRGGAPPGDPDEPWWNDLRAATAHVQAGEYTTARPLLEKGLGAWARFLGGLSPAEQQQWLQDLRKRADIANAAYCLAGIHALLSAGRAGPDAAPQPIDDAERARQRDRAFALLEQVLRLGFSRRTHFEQDSDLTPLHDDPRWPRLLERLQ